MTYKQIKALSLAAVIAFSLSFGFVLTITKDAYAQCPCCVPPGSCPGTQGHRIEPNKCQTLCIWTGTHACDVQGDCTN